MPAVEALAASSALPVPIGAPAGPSTKRHMDASEHAVPDWSLENDQLRMLSGSTGIAADVRPTPESCCPFGSGAVGSVQERVIVSAVVTAVTAERRRQKWHRLGAWCVMISGVPGRGGACGFALGLAFMR